jgi:hypothetical protein
MYRFEGYLVAGQGSLKNQLCYILMFQVCLENQHG